MFLNIGHCVDLFVFISSVPATSSVIQVTTEDVGIFEHFRNKWNILDATAMGLFVSGVALRFKDSNSNTAQILLAFSMMLFYLRTLHMVSFNRTLGPILVMIWKMVRIYLGTRLCLRVIFNNNNNNNNNKVYSLHWQPKRLNTTVRTLWLITNALIISKTSYESITIYERVTN